MRLVGWNVLGVTLGQREVERQLQRPPTLLPTKGIVHVEKEHLMLRTELTVRLQLLQMHCYCLS